MKSNIINNNTKMRVQSSATIFNNNLRKNSKTIHSVRIKKKLGLGGALHSQTKYLPSFAKE
jgi:hypothetical protein